jgi:hypothetical protein
MRKAMSWLACASALIFVSAEAGAAPFGRTETRVLVAPEALAASRTPRATPGPTPLSESERRRYAERDDESPSVKDFKGGDSTIVIGASTATVLLAVVLLIVLL